MKGYSVKEVVELLRQGNSVTFPVQCTMHVMLELANSNVAVKFHGALSEEEITIELVQDQTTLN